MKFTTIILSTFVVALSVSAQNSTSATTTSSVVSGTAPLTPAQSTEAACLEACPANDNDCRTKCIPKGDQTNSIADCITACPKGNGTATDNLNYQNCVESCISSAGSSAAVTPTASGSAPTGTGSSSSGATSGAGGSGSSNSGSSPSATGASGGASGTASSTGATASKSSAADAVQLGSSLIGAAGLLAALFAL